MCLVPTESPATRPSTYISGWQKAPETGTKGDSTRVTPRSAPSPQGHGLRLALRRHLAPSGPGHGFPIPRAKSRVESKRTRPGERPSPSPSSPRGSRAPSTSRPRLRELRELGKHGGLSSPAQTHLRGSVWPWTVFRQCLYHLKKKKKAKPLPLGTGAHRTAPPLRSVFQPRHGGVGELRSGERLSNPTNRHPSSSDLIDHTR